MDELPQLINVLRGEMSLIGPRPERPEIVAQLERLYPDYPQRLVRRPGLTGLAQVLLPPDTDVAAVGVKLKYDLHYVRHVGPWLDLKIALATFFHLVNAPRIWIARAFRFPYFEHVATESARCPEHGKHAEHHDPVMCSHDPGRWVLRQKSLPKYRPFCTRATRLH